MSDEGFKWLLIDSCGTTATLAVGRDERVLASAVLPGRAFSAEWPVALRRLLAESGYAVGELNVVGVVNGPGSFTGVRVGLAAAKGLCEAVGAKLIAVSRLEVLAAFGIADSLAALDAARDEFYVRDGDSEVLMGREEFVAATQKREVVTVDSRLIDALGIANATVVELKAGSALPILLERWQAARFDDVAVIDANYVRGEQDIYARKPAVNGGA